MRPFANTGAQSIQDAFSAAAYPVLDDVWAGGWSAQPGTELRYMHGHTSEIGAGNELHGWISYSAGTPQDMDTDTHAHAHAHTHTRTHTTLDVLPFHERCNTKVSFVNNPTI